MIIDFFKNLCRTVCRHHVTLVWEWFVGISVGWTVTEVSYHFTYGKVPFLKDPAWLYVIGTLSVIWAFFTKWQLAKVEISIKQSNVAVEVLFADIFKCDGITAIPVSEFFDSEIGLPVSPNSLHGIFIKECFGGHPQAFDDQVTSQLSSVRPTQTKKEKGKTARYPIGTTALLESKGKHYLAFALSHADLKTCKASADVPQMFEALAGLWDKARIHMNGVALNLPLVGSGASGVGLPTSDLVHILLLSFADESRRQIVTQKLRIVLTWDRLHQVDLRQLKKSWEEK